jgi:hypothetical protein
MRTHERPPKPSLVKNTIIVTVVAVLTLTALGGIAVVVFAGASRVKAAAESPASSSGVVADAPTRSTGTPGVSPEAETRAAVARMRILIASTQRAVGDQPTGIVSTAKTLHAVEAKISGPADRAAMLLCTDTAAIRREAVDVELAKPTAP